VGSHSGYCAAFLKKTPRGKKRAAASTRKSRGIIQSSYLRSKRKLRPKKNAKRGGKKQKNIPPKKVKKREEVPFVVKCGDAGKGSSVCTGQRKGERDHNNIAASDGAEILQLIPSREGQTSTIDNSIREEQRRSS